MSAREVRPAPWRCDVEGSFAHLTCTVRWPAIVRSLVDDEPDAAPRLSALAEEITSGVVRALAVTTPEALRWHVVDAFVGGPWTALPWYVAESFLYARIREAVGFHESGRDPFLPAKLREEQKLAPPVADEDDDDALARALWRSLWGNRADLSLREAMNHRGAGDDDLVADDRVPALALLSRSRRVGVLLDNAGVELAADLALSRVLARRGIAVTLFAKDVPFFVSDAIAADVQRLVERGHDAGGADLVVDPFFTGPDFFLSSTMARGLRPTSWRALSDCDVVVAKGDCNYRRLLGDAPWRLDDHRAFADAVDLPFDLVALRTLKAEVLVGAEAERTRRAIARDPTWLIDGRHGVVQVACARKEELR